MQDLAPGDAPDGPGVAALDLVGRKLIQLRGAGLEVEPRRPHGLGGRPLDRVEAADPPQQGDVAGPVERVRVPEIRADRNGVEEDPRSGAGFFCPLPAARQPLPPS